MRSDFDKVVTERPRRGSRNSSAKTHVRVNGYDQEYGDRKIDNLPKFESMKWSGDKEFSDVLGPVRGFLASNVGGNWDKLKSECYKQLNTNYPARHVLFTHLLSKVEENVRFIKRGKIKVVVDSKDKDIYTEYYRHPTTGMLMRTPKQQRFNRHYYQKKVLTNSNGHKWIANESTHSQLLVDDNTTINFIGRSWVLQTFKSQQMKEHIKTAVGNTVFEYDKVKTIHINLTSKVLSKKEITYYELANDPYYK